MNISVIIDLPAPFPPDVAQAYLCPNCVKYYWQGGHVARMRLRLEAWQAEFR